MFVAATGLQASMACVVGRILSTAAAWRQSLGTEEGSHVRDNCATIIVVVSVVLTVC
jgi:hypothetical protein